MENKKDVYVHIQVGNGFCGCNYDHYIKFDARDFIPDEKWLRQLAYDLAIENAEMYEDIANDYNIDPDDYDTDEEYEEAIEEATTQYYEGIDYSWEYINEEEWADNGGYAYRQNLHKKM